MSRVVRIKKKNRNDATYSRSSPAPTQYGANKCLTHTTKTACENQKADWLYSADADACEWMEACTGVPLGLATCGDKDGMGPSDAPVADSDCPANWVSGWEGCN